MKLTAPLVALAFSASVSVTEAARATIKDPKLVLSHSPNSPEPDALFSCYHDRVYAYLTWPKKVSGEHTLEGYWYRPDGKLQEHTRLPLALKGSGEKQFFMWLKFHVERNNLSDMVAPQLEDEIFDGGWKVEIFWDGRKAAESAFTVRCI